MPRARLGRKPATPSTAPCRGPLPRRDFLRIGLSGFASLSLPAFLRLRAQVASTGEPRERTALILVWLRGGASHLETYDPKPDAPSEYRGPYAPIATRTPGLFISELLPRHARISDRFTVLRSMAHTGGGHPSGSLQLLSGDTDPRDKPRPTRPDLMSVAHYLRHDPARRLPNYVGINAVRRYDNFQIAGPAYLGPAYDPFRVSGDPNAPNFEVPNIGLGDPREAARLQRRVTLLRGLDGMRRDIDRIGTMTAMDQFESQALALLTSSETARAFRISEEPARVRERYGLNRWGQQCLLARRLVEAGVEIITTEFSGPLCGRVANWDDHAVNHHVFEALKYRAPFFDQAVTALIEDIYERGLHRRVLVVVSGEFGRTPRISRVKSSGGGVASRAAGTVQPGRDHWPHANSMIFAGGNIQTGQVIGATDPRGEYVLRRRFSPQDFLATVYQHLGVDPHATTVLDLSGRPTPIVDNGEPIPELVRRV